MKAFSCTFLLFSIAICLIQCKQSSKGDPSTTGGPQTNQASTAPGGNSSAASPAQGPTFDAVIAKGVVINREIQSPGSIQSEENTNLQPEVSGRITGIYFKEGSIVNKGSLLVKLNDADLKAQRSKLEVQLKISKASEGRQKELLAVNGTSQQEYDLATLQVSNINADLDLNKVNLDKTEIRAPYSGRIGLRNISLGAYVTPQVVLSNIAQVSTLKIEFNVLEKYTHELNVGKIIRFKTESSDKTYDARITAFENTLTNDTRQLKVRAQVLKPDNRLAPGSFITVIFGVGSQAPSIMVPAQAVIPQARDKKVMLYRSGAAAFTTVVTGYRDSSNVEIISGVKAGDTIVTTGLLSIRPGSKVNIKVN